MKRLKSIKGITLIALVITIIILLILAGITISQLTGSGLFENTKLAEQKYSNAQEKEEEQLAKYSNDIDSYVSGNRDYETEINTLKARIVELENANKYTTTEKIVGTWINNEPIYQKTYNLESSITISNNAWYVSNISNSGISAIIKAEAHSNTGTIWNIMAACDTGNYINFLASRDNYTIDVKYITLQYTK